MIEIVCDMCDMPLSKPGALLFSAPDRDNACLKMHLCQKCYMNVRWFVEDGWRNND